MIVPSMGRAHRKGDHWEGWRARVEGAHRQSKEAVQVVVVLLRHPSIVPGLAEVQQNDHLQNEEEAGPEPRQPACAPMK